MMPNSLPSNASLGTILHERALNATPTRLLLDVGVGTAIAVAGWWFHPRLWIVIVCAGLCFVMYGLWATAERQLELGPDDMSQAEESMLGVVRVVAALTGLASALIMTFSLVTGMLGTWIS